MTDNKPAKNLSAVPVVYVHAKGRKQVGSAELTSLLGLGLPVLPFPPVAFIKFSGSLDAMANGEGVMLARI